MFMQQPALPQRLVRFGPFEVDLHTGELRKNGRRVRLQQQPFQILALLLSRPNDLVTRQEIIECLWPNGIVVDYEHSLNKGVKKLREILDDDPDKPRYIETLPKRGYRFVRSVENVDGAALPEAAIAPPAALPHRRSRVWLLVSLAIAIVSAGVGGYFTWKSSRTADKRPPYAKLAVLPFVDLSGDQQEFLSDALTEEMIAQLGSLQPEHLGVIARTTAMHYKGTEKTVREIGRELDVNYILESSVQRAGGRVRITAQLIRVGDETHLWSESYDRDFSDILLLRRDVAQAVANAVEIQLTPQQQSRLAIAHPLNPHAYDLYLMGMYYTEKEWSPAAYEKGREFFQKAVDVDPTFAPPYAALANIYVELRLFGLLSHEEAYPKAKAAALKSLELDNNLPEAHAALGNVKFMLEWDWWGADKDFRRATELHLTRLTGLRKYVRYLMLTGRNSEGLAFHKRMIELDPLSTDLRVVLGWTFKYARQPEDGIRHLEQMLKEDPNLPAIAHVHLAWDYAMVGRYAEAATECEKVQHYQSCAYAYAASGDHKKALRFARKNERNDPVFTAAAYVTLGDKEKALELLERGYREHLPAMVYIWAAPELDALHTDPHFQDLLRRMNFPPHPGVRETSDAAP